MRKYTITFPFKGEYQFLTLTAKQLANALVTKNIDMPDFMLDNENEDLNEIITVKGKKYVVGFGYFDPSTVNVYEYEDDFSGTVIDRNVPYLLMKIEENNNVLYDISDDL